MKQTIVRRAMREELARVNALREEVNALHAAGRPDIFRADFCEALREHVYEKFDSADADVIVALCGGTVAGFAIVEYIARPASPYNRARRYYHIEEIGVDAAFRRRGVGRALTDFFRAEAERLGFDRMELDVWEFNADALAFYDAVGFTCYRRFLELPVASCARSRAECDPEPHAAAENPHKTARCD